MARSDGRFAPSPSGPLHLGNLRTALLAWLFARSAGARFRVRVEDLDPQRSRREHEAGQLADLAALGLDWDGPVERQSERRERHRAALEQLRASGRVYPCWCTRAEIRDAASATHGPLPEGAYPGTCRHLSAAERATREASGRAPALRLDASGERVAFADRLHGPVAAVVDDLVLWRNDDTPAYNVAVVVDDAHQGIGEVVRGDDLLASTPRQLLVARLLGLGGREPQQPFSYAHVPLVLGPDGTRLAKRHGAVTLADRAARGETAADALAWMARSLGLAEPGEPVDPALLLARFDPARLPREPATFAG
jgi:glutamyl-tRNA synthetase